MNTETIVAIAGLAVIVIGHLCSTVWWMSKITTTLQMMSKSVEQISEVIIRHESKYYDKDDAMREFGRIDAKVDKAHQRIDELHDAK